MAPGERIQERRYPLPPVQTLHASLPRGAHSGFPVNRLPTTAYAKESLLREARSIALLGVSQANPMSNTCSNGSVEVRKRERPEQDTTDELRLPEERLTFPRTTAVDKVTGLDRSKASPPLADLAEDEHPGVVQH